MEEDKAGKYVRFSDVEILLRTNKSQAEEIRQLRAKLATLVCGTCRDTGCTHGYKGCTRHPCPVCQPKGTE